MNDRIKFLAAVWLLTAGLSWAQAPTKITIVTPGFDHPVALVAVKILPEVYRSLGYKVEFKTLPPLRAELAFDAGTVDGFIFSDSAFAERHPAAVFVSTPLGCDDLVVFATWAHFPVTGWDSLKLYSIGYQRGMGVVEDNLRERKVTPVDSPPQAFRMLAMGRTDLVVMPRTVGLLAIHHLRLKDVGILEPPLAEVPLYHILTPRWANLAPKLARALDSLEKSGRLKAITDQVLAESLGH